MYITLIKTCLYILGGRAGPQQDHRQRRPLSPVDQDHPARDQRLRLMYKKRGRCFKKPLDATLWPVWQRIPQANDNQTSSKRPLQYRNPPHTATRNQILQNTKRTKKNREKLDKTMFDENIQFLLLTCCTTYCWKNRAPGATISSLVKFKGFI